MNLLYIISVGIGAICGYVKSIMVVQEYKNSTLQNLGEKYAFVVLDNQRNGLKTQAKALVYPLEI